MIYLLGFGSVVIVVCVSALYNTLSRISMAKLAMVLADYDKKTPPLCSRSDDV
jgi:hypothetical protein